MHVRSHPSAGACHYHLSAESGISCRFRARQRDRGIRCAASDRCRDAYRLSAILVAGTRLATIFDAVSRWDRRAGESAGALFSRQFSVPGSAHAGRRPERPCDLGVWPLSRIIRLAVRISVVLRKFPARSGLARWSSPPDSRDWLRPGCVSCGEHRNRKPVIACGIIAWRSS